MCDRPKEKVDKFIDTIEIIQATTTGYGDMVAIINRQLDDALRELHDEPQSN